MTEDTAEKATKLPARRPQLSTGGAIAAIVPTSIDETWRLAGIICEAGWAPKSYGKNQSAVTIGMVAGMEVGLPPLASLQSIALINGMPSLYGDGLLGVVRGSGLLEDFEETIERDDQGEPVSATCRAKRFGQKTEFSQTFTRADAARAKLWGKAGPWTDYPQRMLQMRARGWCLRDGFSDVLKGIHSAEEAIDGGHLVEQDDGSYAPPPRPQRQDFETPAASLSDELENALAETEPDPAPDTFAYIDLDGVEHAADDAEIAAQGFEHKINETETKEQAASLWDDNETFRADLKAADPKRYLDLRQFYSDVTGAVA